MDPKVGDKRLFYFGCPKFNTVEVIATCSRAGKDFTQWDFEPVHIGDGDMRYKFSTHDFSG